MSTAKSFHLKFVKRCQSMLPHQYTSQDMNHMALVNFTLSILDLLSALPEAEEKSRHIKWLYSHLVSSGRGFRGSLNAQLARSGRSERYDPPHLPATYFAIISLLILGDNLSGLTFGSLLTELAQLQRKDGSFTASGSDDDVDVRFTYLAVAIRYILLQRASRTTSETKDINVPDAIAYIRSCRNSDGGYGQEPHAESHSGLTFCALSAQYLLEHKFSPSEQDETIDWLLHRQNHADGGCNGRVAKESDVCYCFWNVSSLMLLNASNLIDKNAICEYLNSCQTKLGGYGKTIGDVPDLYHSYLGIAVQDMLENNDNIDLECCALSITKRALKTPTT